uniref:Gfo/Idh/MocA family oxidoreductase n=1 Tax=Pseudonocardia pini TaxID=2758030 RepID=UPI0015F0CB56
MDRIGVGVVGLSAGRGWAATAHLPALRALPELFSVRASSASSPESGRAGAEAHGVPHACADVRELAEHPEVDLVVVTVKVPEHERLVGDALAAGKAVLCEWPLGNGTAEAER